MQSNTSSIPLEHLTTQELEALGVQLNADMDAQAAPWTQFQPSDEHRSLTLIQQWQADKKVVRK